MKSFAGSMKNLSGALSFTEQSFTKGQGGDKAEGGGDSDDEDEEDQGIFGKMLTQLSGNSMSSMKGGSMKGSIKGSMKGSMKGGMKDKVRPQRGHARCTEARAQACSSVLAARAQVRTTPPPSTRPPPSLAARSTPPTAASRPRASPAPT